MKYPDKYKPNIVQPAEIDDCLTVGALLAFIEHNNISKDTKIVSMRVSDKLVEETNISIVENEGTVIENNEPDQYIPIFGVFCENKSLFLYPF